MILIDSLIYSIGSNGNYVFENAVYDLLGPLCEIHVFDYSANYWESWQEAKNIHFHQWGLSSTYSPPALAENIQEKDFFPFLEIKRKLGHEGRTIDIFKIDCEGCEWYVKSKLNWNDLIYAYKLTALTGANIHATRLLRTGTLIKTG